MVRHGPSTCQAVRQGFMFGASVPGPAPAGPRALVVTVRLSQNQPAPAVRRARVPPRSAACRRLRLPGLRGADRETAPLPRSA